MGKEVNKKLDQKPMYYVSRRLCGSAAMPEAI
jgi:hypothetical protein